MEDAVKRFVWPALKALIAVIVAIALVKIAFFPDQGDSATADITPGYQLSTKTTTVTVGDISSTVEVKGKIVQDKAVEAKATLTGVVDSFGVEKGGHITQGAPLVYLKKVEPQQPKVTTDEEGNTTQTEVPDKVTWDTVYAPTTGTVSFNVIANQDTTAGMVDGTGTVTIKHEIDGQVWYTSYLHMYEDGIHVKVGDTVTAGQMIAGVGNTGRSSGSHLHFEVRTKDDTADESTVEPWGWLKQHNAVELTTNCS